MYTKDHATKLKVLLSSLLLATLLPLGLAPTNRAHAVTDFAIATDYTVLYTYPNRHVTVKESVTIRVNNPDYYLPAGSTQTFELVDFDPQSQEGEQDYKLESLQLKDRNGNKLTYKLDRTGDYPKIIATQPKNLTPGQSYTFVLSYNTHELSNINGNIVNLYVPGLPEGTKLTRKNDSGLSTGYSYTTRLEVLGDSPEASYISPEGLTPKTQGKNTIYEIDTESRIGNSAWIQLGTKQYYYFELIQNAPKTDQTTPEQIANLTEYLSTNIYTIPLPREHSETNQEVLIESITPTPEAIERDEEGNLLAIFETPANEETTIEIKGYISLTRSGVTKNDPLPDFPVPEYSSLVEASFLDQYTQPDKYWESDDPVIKEQADLLLAQATSLQDLVYRDYQYVIDTLDYSYEKLSSDNERYGAYAALTGSQSVCMEYADAVVALLRAQGIASRAAVGYGNDPTGAENAIGDNRTEIQEIGHQWVQVWIPDYGWLSVDPTWGETGRTYIGSNLDHILWFTMGSSEQEYFGGTGLYSADSITNDSFEPYNVYLQSLNEEEFAEVKEDLTDLDEIVSGYDGIEYDGLNYLLKTTMLGRAMIIAIPILALLTIALAIALATTARKRKALDKAQETQNSNRQKIRG